MPIKPITSVKFREIYRLPGYRFGSDGSVWSCIVRGRGRTNQFSDTWRKMNVWVGEFSVMLHLRVTFPDGTSKAVNHGVHRLILEAFVGPPKKGQEGRHLNGDHRDNRLENLAWGTRSENERDKRLNRPPKVSQTYRCPGCNLKANARPDAYLICGNCRRALL